MSPVSPPTCGVASTSGWRSSADDGSAGSPGVHVKPGAAEPAGLQRGQQRGLVDEAAAGDVHEQGPGFHRAERGSSEHSRVTAREHRAADHRVGDREQAGQLIRAGHPLEPGRPAESGTGADPEQPGAERREPGRDRDPDGAQADDHDRRAVQRGTGRPGRPAARRERGPGRRQPPGQGEQVQHGDLRDAVGVAARVTGYPRDQHAEIGRPGDIYLLQADPELMHQPEAARLQHGTFDPGADRADHVGPVQVLADLVPRAADDLPAGQFGGEVGPGQLSGVALAAEQHPHGSAATSSRTGLRLPV